MATDTSTKFFFRYCVSYNFLSCLAGFYIFGKLEGSTKMFFFSLCFICLRIDVRRTVLFRKRRDDERGCGSSYYLVFNGDYLFFGEKQKQKLRRAHAATFLRHFSFWSYSEMVYPMYRELSI